MEELISCAHDIVKDTDSMDAVEFYKSFRLAGVRVNGVDEFDMQDTGSIGSLQDRNVTLYDLMRISKGYDLIANEWTGGFKRCARCGELLLHGMNNAAEDGDCGSNINNMIVYTFLKTLSENRDTFIQTKFDAQTADYVSERALSRNLMRNSSKKELIRVQLLISSLRGCLLPCLEVWAFDKIGKTGA